MTRLTDEELKALTEGCEGVTPGPWEGSGTFVGIYIEGRREWTLVAKTEKGREFPLEYRRNTSHIARCGPVTIRAVASEVLESREAMHGLSVTTDTITDVANQVLESRKRIAELKAALADPNRVHANMLSGRIAKPTWQQIKHLYPVEIAEREAALAKAKETADAEFTAKLRYRDERMAAEAEVKRLREAVSALAEQAAHCIVGFQIGKMDIKKAMIELDNRVIAARAALGRE